MYWSPGSHWEIEKVCPMSSLMCPPIRWSRSMPCTRVLSIQKCNHFPLWMVSTCATASYFVPSIMILTHLEVLRVSSHTTHLRTSSFALTPCVRRQRFLLSRVPLAFCFQSCTVWLIQMIGYVRTRTMIEPKRNQRLLYSPPTLRVSIVNPCLVWSPRPWSTLL